MVSEERRGFWVRFSLFTLLMAPLVGFFFYIGLYTLVMIYVLLYFFVAYYLYRRHVEGAEPISPLLASKAKHGFEELRLGQRSKKIATTTWGFLRRRPKDRDESD